MKTPEDKRGVPPPLQALYDEIPEFKCIPGCTECCGPVPFSKEEWERVSDKRRATSLTCPYAESGRCAIYEQRPLMCRLFGTTEELRCPHGCRPEKMLSSKRAGEIRAAYQKMVGDLTPMLVTVLSRLLGGEVPDPDHEPTERLP